MVFVPHGTGLFGERPPGDLVTMLFPIARRSYQRGGLKVAASDIEVKETSRGLQVRAEIGEVDPKHVVVTVSGDVLTIRGRPHAPESGGAWRTPVWLRKVELPRGLEAARATASIRAGRLSVQIPAAEGTSYTAGETGPLAA